MVSARMTNICMEYRPPYLALRKEGRGMLPTGFKLSRQGSLAVLTADWTKIAQVMERRLRRGALDDLASIQIFHHGSLCRFIPPCWPSRLCSLPWSKPASPRLSSPRRSPGSSFQWQLERTTRATADRTRPKIRRPVLLQSSHLPTPAARKSTRARPVGPPDQAGSGCRIFQAFPLMPPGHLKRGPDRTRPAASQATSRSSSLVLWSERNRIGLLRDRRLVRKRCR